LLASDDDSGPGRNAAVTFTPAAAGTYVVTFCSGAYGAVPSGLAFVELLYANVLHRAPDAAGVDYWLGGLHGGTARTNMLAYLARAPKTRRK
jgi:hypothetical protein